MLFAINNNGNRIKAEISGEIAICETCSNKVRAYCGEINISHWRHLNNIECDNWSGIETEWHRMWKKEFPENWQEQIIKKNGEIHRADIKTANGLVLELQNSSISSTEIKEREIFYDNMVWLINVANFKGNFVIWSEVNSHLRNFNRNNSEEYILTEDETNQINDLNSGFYHECCEIFNFV